MSFEDWSSDRQRRWRTPRRELEEIVRRVAGHGVTSIERIQRGAMNEVWSAIAGDEHLVVRIAHRSDVRLAAEAWALNRCEQVGAPVAQVLGFEDHTREPDPFSVLVLAKLQGEPLEWAKDHMERTVLVDTVEAVGSVLARVHGIALDDFGMLDAEGRGSSSGWAHPSTFLASAERWLPSAADKAGVNVLTVANAAARLREHAALFGSAPHLVHADVRPAHVLVANAKLTGLIDFEFCQGGDPIYDLAFWDFNLPDEQLTGALLRGYGVNNPDELFWRRFRCCRLLVSLQYLNWFRGPDQPWASLAPTIAKNLDADLKHLSE